jgi:hypothetical protein
MAEMPSQQGGQLPLQQWQRCLPINGNNTIATRASTPLWWWQGSLCNNDDVNSIATRATKATMPAWQWQGRLRINNGNNAIVTRATIAITTTVERPAHQEWWRHHNEGNNASSTTSNKGNNASLKMVKTPAHQQWQQPRCDKSNNCYQNTGKDACKLTAMTPSQQGQQRQLDDKQKMTILMMMTTPLWQGQQH